MVFKLMQTKRGVAGSWRSMMVMVAAAAMVAGLGLTGCDDESGTGDDDTGADVMDTCQGFGCEGDFRENDTTTTMPDTSEPDTTMPDTNTAECTDGEFECQGTDTLRTCVEGVWEESLCVDPDVCDATAGACVPSVCPTPGAPFDCADDTTRRICGEDRLSFETETCAGAEEQCRGAGSCSVSQCIAGEVRCSSMGIEVCKEDETGWEFSEACGDDEFCEEGACVSYCEARAKGTASYEGCEYYVVDMDNESEGADDTEFGITISNGGNQVPGEFRDVQVTITGPNGFSQTVTVPAGGLQQVGLPSNTDADSSGLKANGTFRVVSSLPVSVHQFNPLNQSEVFSNDASLLLPVTSLGTDYIALNWPVSSSFQPEAYIDVVGTANNTTVSITSPVNIPAGAGFGQIPANVPTNIVVNAGELLHLVSSGTAGDDLSGLQIIASEPVAVFAGTRCSLVPDGYGYCDHLEQQLFPTTTWGTTYIAAKSNARGTEEDIWRIVAAENGTTVTFEPAQNGTSTVTLDRSEVYELASTGDFKITGDKPILVGQFIAGSNAPGVPTHPSCTFPIDLLGGGGTCDEFTCSFLGGGTCVQDSCAQTCANDTECHDTFCLGDPSCEAAVFCDPATNVCAQGTGIGDPAYSLSVPSDQYRGDYIVMTPSGYEENYLTLITDPGDVPSIDYMPIDMAPYNATPTSLNAEKDIWRVRVGEGVHTLTNMNNSFGVMSYGYDCDVSYAYPGGLDLEIIN